MIKQILILTGVFLLLSVQLMGAMSLQERNIQDKAFRKQLIQAVNSSKKTDSLYQSLIGIKNKSALMNAYIGTLQALKARHAWNPYNKIKYVDNAEKTFEKAVAEDPHNMEIRFMRLSVEHNLPGFLGYNKNMVADREEIIKQLDNKHNTDDKEMVITIITYLLKNNTHTETENIYLNKQLVALR